MVTRTSRNRKSGLSPAVSSQIAAAASASRTSSDNLLTVTDIQRGGDRPLYTRVEIPELSKDGKPGVVYTKPISTAAMLKIMQLGEADRTEQAEWILGFLESTLVTPDGSPLMTREQMMEVPLETLSDILGAIANARKGGGAGTEDAASGKGPSLPTREPAAPSASSTDSPTV